MARWEYDVVELGTNEQLWRWPEVLNTLGADGWELVAIQESERNFYGVIKRPSETS